MTWHVGEPSHHRAFLLRRLQRRHQVCDGKLLHRVQIDHTMQGVLPNFSSTHLRSNTFRPAQLRMHLPHTKI